MNKPLFSLYEASFLVLKKNLGYEKAVELFKQILEESLGKALDEYKSKKGDPNEFARVMRDRDRSVGNEVDIEVKGNTIFYKAYTEIFPNLKGEIEIEDLTDAIIGPKVRHLLGKGWSYKTAKHAWKGDAYREYVITKD